MERVERVQYATPAFASALCKRGLARKDRDEILVPYALLLISDIVFPRNNSTQCRLRTCCRTEWYDCREESLYACLCFDGLLPAKLIVLDPINGLFGLATPSPFPQQYLLRTVSILLSKGQHLAHSKARRHRIHHSHEFKFRSLKQTKRSAKTISLVLQNLSIGSEDFASNC